MRMSIIHVSLALLFVLPVMAAAAAEKPAPPTAAEVAKAKQTGKYTVTVVTTKGTVTLQLDGKAAPRHVANMVKLTQRGFYNGIKFHRVVPGFVAQAGDPLGTGAGGPGYTIKDEASSLKHAKGALGMAKTSMPDSAGSQWYICLEPLPKLDGRYTVFGKVTQGMAVVEKIAQGDKITKMTVKPTL